MSGFAANLGAVDLSSANLGAVDLDVVGLDAVDFGSGSLDSEDLGEMHSVGISVDNRCGEQLPLAHIEELALFVLQREGLSENLELAISFVDIDEMTTLNATYRGIAKATDVLSFECDNPSNSTDPGLQKASGEPRIIGDVVINPDVARRHALLEEVSLEEEIWILLIHGILHLIGYDHEKLQDANDMEAREDEHFYEWELLKGKL